MLVNEAKLLVDEAKVLVDEANCCHIANATSNATLISLCKSSFPMKRTTLTANSPCRILCSSRVQPGRGSD